MNKILDLISNFFEIKNEEKESETVEESVKEEDQKKGERVIKLTEVIDFVRELEAYYTNDIFKKRTDYINNSLTEDWGIFLKKKIQEYEFAVKLIIEIKEKLLEKERSCKDLYGKVSYSFFDELENEKFNLIFQEAFEIVEELMIVNVIPELDHVIRNRLVSYQQNWKLDDKNLSEITSLRIIERKGNIETYQFGNFQKEVIDTGMTKELLPQQLRAIKKMKVQVSFKNPFIDTVWIRCVTVNRQQLEFLKKTTAFVNDWEDNSQDNLIYDIVQYSEIEYYIRAIVQLILARKDYIVITIINPNISILPFIKEAIEIDDASRKVKVTNKMTFLLSERTKYDDNLQFAYLSKRHSLQKLDFHSFNDFVRKFLK